MNLLRRRVALAAEVAAQVEAAEAAAVTMDARQGEWPQVGGRPQVGGAGGVYLLIGWQRIE